MPRREFFTAPHNIDRFVAPPEDDATDDIHVDYADAYDDSDGIDAVFVDDLDDDGILDTLAILALFLRNRWRSLWRR